MNYAPYRLTSSQAHPQLKPHYLCLDCAKSHLSISMPEWRNFVGAVTQIKAQKSVFMEYLKYALGAAHAANTVASDMERLGSIYQE
jgi:hypothetical protein